MRFFLSLSLVFLLVACHNSKRDAARVPFVEVNGEFMYLDEIQEVIPHGASMEDSIAIAENYVHNWIVNHLLYEHAGSNTENLQEINELTEAYRRSLIIHQYRQNIFKERFNREVSEDEMKNFYEQNKENFRLAAGVVKGIFIKLPSNAPKLDELINNLQHYNAKSLEKIEKYSFQNAAEYEYFGERWLPVSDILKKLPLTVENPSQFSFDKNLVQLNDSTHSYLLRVLDSRNAGDIEPFEQAKEKIQIILTNQLKTDFIHSFEENLYNDAIKKNNIKFYQK